MPTKRKSNGHAAPSETQEADAAVDQGDETQAQIAARIAVDLVEAGRSDIRAWMIDNLGDISVAFMRYDRDPESERRGLQNDTARHLAADANLLDWLQDLIRPQDPNAAPAAGTVAAEAAAEVAAAAAEPSAEADPAPAAETEEAPIRANGFPQIVTVTARRLKGDLVRYFLDRLQHEQEDRRPWKDRPEADQRRTIANVGDMVEDALRRAFATMLSERPRVVSGKLESVTAKEDGVKAVVKLSGSGENMLTLFTGAGEIVQMAVADPAAFMAMGDGVPVTLDQTELPVQPPEPEPAPPPEAPADDMDELPHPAAVNGSGAHPEQPAA